VLICKGVCPYHYPIFNVQKDRCLYDFLNALRTVDVIFVVDKKTILNYEVQQEKSSSFILDFLKKFRNHLRIIKTLLNQIDHTNKKINHSIFANLRSQNTKSNKKSDHKCFDNCDHFETFENFESKSILIVIESNEKKYSNWLCEMFHRYMKCFYIRLKIKKSDWNSDSSIIQMIKINIAETIDEIKFIINRIFKRNAKTANKEKEKLNKSENTNHIENENFIYSFFAMSSSFAIDSILYKLLNCWILNDALNIHVCNDSSKFQFNRFVNFDDQLRVEKIVYSIERYDTVHIVVKKSHDSINIQLLDVVFASNFLMNFVSLNRFTIKNVHWDIEKRHLHTNDVMFCYIESVKKHWVLKNNFSSSDQFTKFAAFAINSIKSKSDKIVIDTEWHIMLSHAEIEIIEHLQKAVDDVKIIDDSSVFTTIACETCALIKTHHVISRRLDQFESINYFLNRVDFDLIFMHRAYNDD
jgi:hypothetical protein